MYLTSTVNDSILRFSITIQKVRPMLKMSTTTVPACFDIQLELESLPIDIQMEGLPLKPGTTVAGLLAFDPPPVDPSSSLEPDAYFSVTVPPPFELRNILCAPIPRAKVVDDLRKQAGERWLQGLRSIALGSLKYPFAVITYWRLAHEAILAQDSWRSTLSKLEATDVNEVHTGMVQQARLALLALDWRGLFTFGQITAPVMVEPDAHQFLSRDQLPGRPGAAPSA